jgi:hypothetical protein
MELKVGKRKGLALKVLFQRIHRFCAIQNPLLYRKRKGLNLCRWMETGEHLKIKSWGFGVLRVQMESRATGEDGEGTVTARRSMGKRKRVKSRSYGKPEVRGENWEGEQRRRPRRALVKGGGWGD